MLVALAMIAGVLTLGAPSAHAAAATVPTVVAMGDSYASGEGNPPFYTNALGDSTADGCHRSMTGGHVLFAQALLGSTTSGFVQTACAGADDASFLSGTGTPKEPPQLNYLSAATRVVTLSVGGNTVGFEPILEACDFTDVAGNGCTDELLAANQRLIAMTTPSAAHQGRSELEDIYYRIRQAAPNARLLVAGYPMLFPPTWNGNCALIEQAATPDINLLTAKGNKLIAQAAAAEGATYVDLATPFTGHSSCEVKGSNDYINYCVDFHVTGTHCNAYSFHPNATGQKVIAQALTNAYGSSTIPPLPATPTLRVTGTTPTSVTLAWTSVAGATGYRVYEGSTLRVTTTGTSTTIGSLASSSSHTYQVSAYSSVGESAASNAVTATTMVALPAAPTLRTTATTASSISLAWSAATGASGYHVYEGSTLKATTSATSVTIGSLASNSTHTYLVKAYNAAGESAASNAVSATTNFTYLYAVTSQTASADVGHARPGQAITITITVKNTGTATWSNSGSNPVNLATIRPQNHASPFQSPGWISSSRPAALQQASVPPAGTGTFSFAVTAPAAAGTVTDYFTLVAENKSWFNDPGTSVTVTTQPIVGVASVPGTTGVWTVATDGGVTTSGGAPFFGSMGGQHLNAPIDGIAATPTGGGYWLVGADGGVFAYGDAGFYGSMAGRSLNAPIVGIAATPSGHGYWLAGADGGVFAYGDAGFAGSMAGQALNRPIVGIAAGPDNNGYRLVGADGGVFAYGDAGFAGSMAGQPMNAPIVGIAGTSDGAGYWLVGADGGIYAYGDAGFGGSLGGTGSAHPVVGVTRTSAGYDIADTIGTVTTYAATPPPPPPPPPAPSTLYPGSQLNPGAALTSPSGKYRLVMQGDGNLVEYDGGTPVWASNTFTAGSVLLDQSDGNFVIVAPGNVPVWATGTNQPNSVLTVQNDRNVVVYAPGNVPIWATNTGI